MREGLTNAGKKEQRQFNHLMEREVKQGGLKQAHHAPRDVESRTVPKQHGMKRKNK